MYKRQRAATLSLLFGAVYFLTEGLSVLFNEGRPYLKFMKHIDLALPLYWCFWLAEKLGLYQPVFLRDWDWSFFAQLRAISFITLIYMAAGYILGLALPQQSTWKRGNKPVPPNCGSR